MKKTAVAACVMLLPCVALAQPVIGPYVSLGAGVNLQQTEVEQKDPQAGISGDHHFSFDAGFSGKVAVGYGFGYGFRAELEADYLTNSINGYGYSESPIVTGGSEQKYGGMGNILYDFDFGFPVYPYIGAGLGGMAVEHDHFFARFANSPVFPTGVNTQSHGSFAYQGIAGLAFPLPFMTGLSATLEYRFLGFFNPLGPYDSTRYDITYPNGLSTQRKFSNDLNHSIMLGVRYALFQPPPAVTPAPPAPPAAPPAAPAARTYLVFFDWDRADLTERARQIVAEAAAASTHVATTRIEVNGYTDLSGTAAYNQKLSVRRARTVEAELVKDGVSQGEIEIHGYGESNPLVPTAPGVREPQNRRVEIILH
jgi:outer membrane protein OmpA-like peptidoglycan-associated protein